MTEQPTFNADALARTIATAGQQLAETGSPFRALVHMGAALYACLEGNDEAAADQLNWLDVEQLRAVQDAAVALSLHAYRARTGDAVQPRTRRELLRALTREAIDAGTYGEPAPEPAGPSVRATHYEVSCMPPEHDLAHSLTIRVEWRGGDRYAVLNRLGYALGADGEWDHESVPSERTDEWKATHRFGLDAALDHARREATRVRVGGRTAAQWLAEDGG